MERVTPPITAQPSEVDLAEDALAAALSAPDPWTDDGLLPRHEVLPLKWRFGRECSDDDTLTKLSGQHGYFVQTADGQPLPIYITRSELAGRRSWNFSCDNWEALTWLDASGLHGRTYLTRSSALGALGEAVLEDQDILIEFPPQKHPACWGET